jgi:hypothetical protein
MAITSNDDVAEFRGTELADEDLGCSPQVIRGSNPTKFATSLSDQSEDDVSEDRVAAEGVWVLCRKHANGDVETVRVFDDENRARADMDLAESVSRDEFWLADVPLIETASNHANGITPVQVLALTWLAQGADAEVSVPLVDPVVVSPRHVRGCVSVPSHEWRDMEDHGWVRDGLITTSGAEQIGLVRKSSDHGVG